VNNRDPAQRLPVRAHHAPRERRPAASQHGHGPNHARGLTALRDRARREGLGPDRRARGGPEQQLRCLPGRQLRRDERRGHAGRQTVDAEARRPQSGGAVARIDSVGRTASLEHGGGGGRQRGGGLTRRRPRLDHNGLRTRGGIACAVTRDHADRVHALSDAVPLCRGGDRSRRRTSGYRPRESRRAVRPTDPFPSTPKGKSSATRSSLRYAAESGTAGLYGCFDSTAP
jgi:hypothetical protein